MEYGPRPKLLDADGSPLDGRIESTLTRLMPRFQREYPSIPDDQTRTEVFEEAGRRIADRERRHGPIEKLPGYAWVTLRSVATSWLRRGSSRLADRTLPCEESEAALRLVPARTDAVEQIERDILLREVLARLSDDERMVCVWKKTGFSSQEIAKQRGGTAAAVDTVFSRAKQKIRVALGLETVGSARPAQAAIPADASAATAAKDDATPNIGEAHVRSTAAS
jgi:RNA polymerase sigma factor (sigma-70 family)